MAGVGRFRVNILRQRSSFMIVMRVIPIEIPTLDRKSTRLNSSHANISYAVFCLKNHTIECVRVVVDSVLSRVPRYEPDMGLTRLETVRVSRAGADQRRGRAGRMAPSVDRKRPRP